MQIAYKPWESLEIKSYTVFPSAEQFVEAATAAIPPNAAGVATFLWGNGVLFRFQALAGGQGSDVLTTNFLRGRVIWEAVEAAPMPNLQSELHLPGKPMLSIRIQDVSLNTFLGPVTEWLSENVVASKVLRKTR